MICKITFGLLFKYTFFIALFLIAAACNKEEEEVLYSPGSGVTDVDGNFYPSVILDNGQEWTAANLRTTRYCNGDTIEQEMDSVSLISNMDGGWTWYDFNSSYNEPYGKLYNGYAVNNPAGLCPCGWHVPSNTEWDELINFLGGQDTAGGKMKLRGSEFWSSTNENSSNSSGFSAYPGGKFSFPISKSFEFLGTATFWWSETEVNSFSNWNYYLNSYSSVVSKYEENLNKISYMSVRCIKN